MNTKRLFLRGVSLCLIGAFFIQDAAQAGSVALPPRPLALEIPGIFASIKEVHQTSAKADAPFLIHIQDAHTNSSAQVNLAKTLEHLIKDQDIHTIFVEAGTKDDSLTALRPLADRPARERVAKKFMMRGEMNGAEYLSLSSDEDIRLLGVEDAALYEKNLKLYAKLAAGREKILAYIDEIKKRSDALKRALYPKNAFELDNLIGSYEAKNTDFTEFYSKLSSAASGAGIEARYYANFASLSELKSQEEKIDFKKANEEQVRLLAEIAGRDAAAAEELSVAGAELRHLHAQSHVPVSFYEMMFKKAGELGLRTENYPNLFSYLAYLRTFAAVDLEKLSEECRSIEDALFVEQLENPKALYLHEIDNFLKILKRLFELQMTHEDFEDYERGRTEAGLETIAIVAFLNRELYDRSRDEEILEYTPVIEQSQPLAEEFYKNNSKRDETFVSRSIEVMRKEQIKKAVLLTGGFHTANLSRLLRDAGASYAVVTPRLDHETNIPRYESLLLSQIKNSEIKTDSQNASSSMMLEPVIELPKRLEQVKGSLEDYKPVVTLAGSRLAKVEKKLYLNQLHEGVGERTPDWARMALVASVFLESKDKFVPLRTLYNEAKKKYGDYGLNNHDDDQKTAQILERLKHLGLVKEELSSYAPEDFDGVSSKRLLAVKINYPFYILDELRAAINAKEDLQSMLLEYDKITQLWHFDPVESTWPVLKAVALLHENEQAQLLEFLKSRPDITRTHLGYYLYMMLTGKPVPGWSADQVANLKGRDIIYVSSETWQTAGGLGPVGQYHSVGMKQLLGDGSEVVTIEPLYAYKLLRKQDPTSGQMTDEMIPLDYSKLPTPVEGLSSEPNYEFEVNVRGEAAKVHVFEGINEHGIKVVLIKHVPATDKSRNYTKFMYRYGEKGNASWEEFSEFFSRASLEYIRLSQLKKWKAKPEAFKAPGIILNDGQLGIFAAYKRELDYEASRQADPKADPNPLENALLWYVTHTYGNRGAGDKQYTAGFYEGAEIPGALMKYADRGDKFDPTSMGRRASDVTSAVSSVHSHEVAHIDPTVKGYAITNGDNLAYSGQFFDAALNIVAPNVNPYHADYKQIFAAAQQAKITNAKDEELTKLNPGIKNIDPKKPVIGYFGRLVPEKVSMSRAFTEENILAYVKAGIQVIIGGNYQGKGSEELYRRLKAVEKAVQDLKEKSPDEYPGTFIFIDGFNLPQKMKLLSMTDLQIQDSDRGTEAAGYSESDVSRNGGLQMAPPGLEGILQNQGILLDRAAAQPGMATGNTIVPKDENPASYQEAVLKMYELYKQVPEIFATWEAASIRLSRILNALLPASEYLLQISMAFERKNNPEKVLDQFLAKSDLAKDFLMTEWLRRDLVKQLDADSRFIPLTSTNPRLKAYAYTQNSHWQIVVIHPFFREHTDVYMSGEISGKETFQKIFDSINPSKDKEIKIAVVDSREGKQYDMYSSQSLLDKGLPVAVGDPGVQVLEVLLKPTTSTENGARLAAPARRNFLVATAPLTKPVGSRLAVTKRDLAWARSIPDRPSGRAYAEGAVPAQWNQDNFKFDLDPMIETMDENSVVLDMSTGTGGAALYILSKLKAQGRKIKKLVLTEVDFPMANEFFAEAVERILNFEGLNDIVTEGAEFYTLNYDKSTGTYGSPTEIEGLKGKVTHTMMENAIHLIPAHQRPVVFNGVYELSAPNAYFAIGSGNMGRTGEMPADTIALDALFDEVHEKGLELISSRPEYSALKESIATRPASNLKSDKNYREAFLPKHDRLLADVSQDLSALGFETDIQYQKTNISRNDYRDFIIHVPGYVAMNYPEFYVVPQAPDGKKKPQTEYINPLVREEVLRRAYETVFDEKGDRLMHWTSLRIQKPNAQTVRIHEAIRKIPDLERLRFAKHLIEEPQLRSRKYGHDDAWLYSEVLKRELDLDASQDLTAALQSAKAGPVIDASIRKIEARQQASLQALSIPDRVFLKPSFENFSYWLDHKVPLEILWTDPQSGPLAPISGTIDKIIFDGRGFPIIVVDNIEIDWKHIEKVRVLKSDALKSGSRLAKGDTVRGEDLAAYITDKLDQNIFSGVITDHEIEVTYQGDPIYSSEWTSSKLPFDEHAEFVRQSTSIKKKLEEKGPLKALYSVYYIESPSLSLASTGLRRNYSRFLISPVSAKLGSRLAENRAINFNDLFRELHSYYRGVATMATQQIINRAWEASTSGRWSAAIQLMKELQAKRPPLTKIEDEDRAKRLIGLINQQLVQKAPEVFAAKPAAVIAQNTFSLKTDEKDLIRRAVLGLLTPLNNHWNSQLAPEDFKDKLAVKITKPKENEDVFTLTFIWEGKLAPITVTPKQPKSYLLVRTVLGNLTKAEIIQQNLQELGFGQKFYEIYQASIAPAGSRLAGGGAGFASDSFDSEEAQGIIQEAMQALWDTDETFKAEDIAALLDFMTRTMSAQFIRNTASAPHKLSAYIESNNGSTWKFSQTLDTITEKYILLEHLQGIINAVADSPRAKTSGLIQYVRGLKQDSGSRLAEKTKTVLDWTAIVLGNLQNKETTIAIQTLRQMGPEAKIAVEPLKIALEKYLDRSAPKGISADRVLDIIGILRAIGPDAQAAVPVLQKIASLPSTGMDTSLPRAAKFALSQINPEVPRSGSRLANAETGAKVTTSVFLSETMKPGEDVEATLAKLFGLIKEAVDQDPGKAYRLVIIPATLEQLDQLEQFGFTADKEPYTKVLSELWGMLQDPGLVETIKLSSDQKSMVVTLRRAPQSTPGLRTFEFGFKKPWGTLSAHFRSLFGGTANVRTADALRSIHSYFDSEILIFKAPADLPLNVTCEVLDKKDEFLVYSDVLGFPIPSENLFTEEEYKAFNARQAAAQATMSNGSPITQLIKDTPRPKKAKPVDELSGVTLEVLITDYKEVMKQMDLVRASIDQINGLTKKADQLRRGIVKIDDSKEAILMLFNQLFGIDIDVQKLDKPYGGVNRSNLMLLAGRDRELLEELKRIMNSALPNAAQKRYTLLTRLKTSRASIQRLIRLMEVDIDRRMAAIPGTSDEVPRTEVMRLFEERGVTPIAQQTVTDFLIQFNVHFFIGDVRSNKPLIYYAKDSIRIYLNKDKLTASDYLDVLQAIMRPLVVSKMREDLDISGSQYAVLRISGFVEMMTWLQMSWDAQELKLNDEENAVISRRLIFPYIFTVLQYPEDISRDEEVTAILGSSEMGAVYRDVITAFKTLSHRSDIAEQMGAIKQKTESNKNAGLGATALTPQEMEMIGQWVAEFWKLMPKDTGSRLASSAGLRLFPQKDRMNAVLETLVLDDEFKQPFTALQAKAKLEKVFTRLPAYLDISVARILSLAQEQGYVVTTDQPGKGSLYRLTEKAVRKFSSAQPLEIKETPLRVELSQAVGEAYERNLWLTKHEIVVYLTGYEVIREPLVEGKIKDLEDFLDRAGKNLSEMKAWRPDLSFRVYPTSSGIAMAHTNGKKKTGARLAYQFERGQQIASFHFDNSIRHNRDGNYRRALKEIDKALRIDSKNRKFLTYKAILLSNSEKYREALFVADKVIQIDFQYKNAYFARARALLGLNKYEEVLETVHQSQKLKPIQFDDFYIEARALYALGRNEEAMDSLRQAMRLSKFHEVDFDVSLLGVLILNAMGKSAEAREFAKPALAAAKPTSFRGRVNYAQLLYEIQRISEANSLVSQLLREDANDSKLNWLAGSIRKIISQQPAADQRYWIGGKGSRLAEDTVSAVAGRILMAKGLSRVAQKVYPILVSAGIALISFFAAPNASAAEVTVALAQARTGLTSADFKQISSSSLDVTELRAKLARERVETTVNSLIHPSIDSKQAIPAALPAENGDISSALTELLMENPSLSAGVPVWNSGAAKNAWNRMSQAFGKAGSYSPDGEYTLTMPYEALFNTDGSIRSVVDFKETVKALKTLMQVRPAKFTILVTHQGEVLGAEAEARVQAALENWNTVPVEFLQVQAGKTLVGAVSEHVQGKNIHNLAKVIVGVDLHAAVDSIGNADSLKNSKLENKLELYGVETPADSQNQGFSAAAVVFTAAKTLFPDLLLPSALGLSSDRERTPFGLIYVVHPFNIGRDLLRTLVSKQATLASA